MTVRRFIPAPQAQAETPATPLVPGASQALSPWPAATAVVSRTAAVSRLKAAIAGRAAKSDAVTCTLGELAAARVERDAPGAPQAVKDEAVIRLAGYWSQADFGTIRKEEAGPMVREFVTNHANAWRSSGAAGLLAPWKIRRAGVIA